MAELAKIEISRDSDKHDLKVTIDGEPVEDATSFGLGLPGGGWHLMLRLVERSNGADTTTNCQVDGFTLTAHVRPPREWADRYGHDGHRRRPADA